MWGIAAPPALHGQGRGISFGKRDTPPFDPPRENYIGSLELEGVRRLGSGSLCVAALLRSPPLGVRDDLAYSYYPLPLSNLSVGAV